MQTSLMFLDLTTKGLDLGLQKIAIKMPKGAGDVDISDIGEFGSIIGALMESMSTEQLQNSFKELEWVPVEGDASGFAPLIDLSAEQGGKALDMAKQLFDQSLHITKHGSFNPTPSVNVPIHTAGDNAGLQFQTGEIMRDEFAMAGKWASDDSELDQLNLSPKHEDLPRGASEEKLTDPLKNWWLDNGKDHNKALDKDAILNKNDGPKIDLEKITDREAKPPKSDFIERKELPPVTNANDVKPNQKSSEYEFKSPTNDSSQHQLNTKMSMGNETGQHFSEKNNEDDQLFLRYRTKDKDGSEGANTNIKLSSLETTVEKSNDMADPQSKAMAESRESFHAHLSKSNASLGKNVEFVSGAKEMHPTSQDTENNVIRQIVQRMTLQTQGTQSSMTIKLKPEFLGNVHMQISTDHQQVIVRMATDSVAVKEMIEQGLQHLKSELQQHGLEIDKFDVFVANDNDESNHSQDLAGFRQALKRQRQNGMKNKQRDGEEGSSNPEAEAKTQPLADGTSEIDYFA